MIICLGEKLGEATMAFNGVRISWLILARKAIFIRLPSSTFSICVISIQKTRYAFNTSVRIIFKRNGEGICPAVIRVSVQHDP